MDAKEIRDAILGAQDLPTEVVEVEEWGQKIILRGLTAAERDDYLAAITDMSSGSIRWRNASALLVVRSVVTESGERVFADADASLLGEKSAKAVASLFDVAMKLNGLSESDVEEIKETFHNAQSDASSTS